MEKKWWTLLAVCTGTFMLLLDVTIVVVALPEIQRSLHASFGDVEWVIDAYALTLASLLLTAGVLADRYGRRRLFTIGLVIFTLGSLTCGLAQSPAMLIVSRSAQGVGGAIMFATSLALLAHAFRGKDRGVAFGIWGAITGVAVSLGPILGGAITTGISWRGIFLVNVPVGVVAVAVTLWRVEESREAHPGRPDWAGFVLLTLGLVSLVYGLTRAGETSWGNGGVIIALALGAVLLALFVAAELRTQAPLFDFGLFRTPTFVGGLVAAFTMNGSLFAMFLYLVLYLQDILGLSALSTGLRLLASTGGMFFAAAVSGRLSEHVPVRYLIAARSGPRRRRPVHDDRFERDQLVDAPPARARRSRRRFGDGEPTSGLHCRRCRCSPACRDGLRGQLDVPPGRVRHLDRRPGFDLRHDPATPPRVQVGPGARAGPPGGPDGCPCPPGQRPPGHT